MAAALSLVGQVFGKLTVLDVHASDGNHRRWRCICVCGNETFPTTSSLRIGSSASCGVCCRRREASPNSVWRTAEYAAWSGMKSRCTNKNVPSFKDYGGRGITVCEAWAASFSAFLADMGPRPSPDHSLDRYPDNDGEYGPNNCRWATKEEQLNNTRKNKFVFYRGSRMTVSQAVHTAGDVVAPQVASDRLSYGWTVDEAVETRPGPPGSRRRKTTASGAAG